MLIPALCLPRFCAICCSWFQLQGKGKWKSTQTLSSSLPLTSATSPWSDFRVHLPYSTLGLCLCVRVVRACSTCSTCVYVCVHVRERDLMCVISFSISTYFYIMESSIINRHTDQKYWAKFWLPLLIKTYIPIVLTLLYARSFVFAEHYGSLADALSCRQCLLTETRCSATSPFSYPHFPPDFLYSPRSTEDLTRGCLHKILSSP